MGNVSHSEIGVALLGFGNVGRGTYRILDNHAAELEKRLGAKISVRHVLVRSLERENLEGLPRDLLTTDAERIFGDPKVSIVVELIGGTRVAHPLVQRAILTGRHVVTANKALLAEHGESLFSSAVAHGVELRFEAAVCGGIPIIRTIREALSSDRIEGVFGIVNGTTNFILTSMEEDNTAFEDALAQAQKLGFAEADSSFDVSGMDAGQKLSLLTSLAFMSRINPSQIHVEGIEAIRPIDIAMAREFGFVLKLLAISRKLADGSVDARVHPAFVPAQSPLAKVRGAYNAILLQSAALGASLFYGQGAGALPTGSAVVSDIVDIGRNILTDVSTRLPLPCEPNISDVVVRPVSLRTGAYYLRFTVSDEPGVLGRIAGVLGEKGVSIASVIQRQPQPGETHATIVVFTHSAKEADVSAAIQWIDQLTSTCAKTQVVRIEMDVPVG